MPILFLGNIPVVFFEFFIIKEQLNVGFKIPPPYQIANTLMIATNFFPMIKI